MFRGSTPTHIFDLGEHINSVSEIEIKYAQQGVEKFTKTLDDCLREGTTFRLTLKQDDTLLFDQNIPVVDIQLRIKTINGDVIPSYIMKTPLYECLFNEVM